MTIKFCNKRTWNKTRIHSVAYDFEYKDGFGEVRRYHMSKKWVATIGSVRSSLRDTREDAVSEAIRLKWILYG